MMKSFFVSLFLINDILALPLHHQVHRLPGLSTPPVSRIFSGHVNAGTKIHSATNSTLHKLKMHYMFIEAEVENPLEAPVLLWTNGGPGAASMYGLLVEVGPYQLSLESLHTKEYMETKIPTLIRNEHSWTKVANLLILNGPAPVGFSYCDTPVGDGYSCGDWDDHLTARHNAIFLENWAALFPEYLQTKWFLSGESYAGVYVPMLAREILRNETSLVKPLLEGFAVGDACVGTDVICGSDHASGQGGGPLSNIQFLYGHGQFSTKLYNQIMNECPKDQLVGYGVPLTDKNCQNLLAKMKEQVGYYFPYNLYDECWYENGSRRRNVHLKSSYAKNDVDDKIDNDYFDDEMHVDGYACGGSMALSRWLNRPEVKLALNVDLNSRFFSGDNGVGFTYKYTEKNLLPFYKYVAENENLRVLVYNGDTDPAINSIVSQNWTSYLGFEEEEEWRPWTADNRLEIGGYVTRYKVKGAFDFLTIRNSGHMVPVFQPKMALEMIKQWLDNKNWQRFHKGPNDE